MRPLLVMAAGDLRQRVRDRSVLIFALVVPLALIAVFRLVFGDGESVTLEPVTVAVSVPAGDVAGRSIVDTLDGVDAPSVTLRPADADEVGLLVRAGDVDVGIVVPDGFGDSLRSGAGGGVVELVAGDGAGLGGDIVVAVTRGVLDRLDAASTAAAAGAVAGLPPGELAAVADQAVTGGPGLALEEGEASTEQLSAGGSIVAGQAGLFLLFTVGFGVLALLAEREQGTLARLRSLPISPFSIVAAKVLSGYVLGVVATTVLLTAGSVLFDVGFGSLPAVAVLVLAVAGAATSLTFVVARVAGNAEQANVAQSVLALLLGVTGGAFFPVTASGPVGRLLDLNPIAAFTRGLGITSGGGGVTDLAAPLLVLVSFGVVCVLAARLLPDRRGAT